MGLRLGINDMLSYNGWFYRLRRNDQQSMTLDVFRGEPWRTFSVRDGSVFDGDTRICDVAFSEITCVIDSPDSLIHAVLNPAPALIAPVQETPPETVPKPVLMVA